MNVGNWIKDESYIAGIPVRQNHLAFIAFNSFFAQQKFDRVIEFGTGLGGFTLFLAIIKAAQDFELYSYDIEKMPNTNVREFLERNEANIVVGDLFLHKNHIRDLVSKEGRVLILCDNGDKVKEFNEFSKYLKNNDVIMCHDYYDTREKFESDPNRTWDWCEITRVDIQESIDIQYLCQTYIECFKDSHWACFVKNNPKEIGFKPVGYMLFPNEINILQWE